MNPHQALVNGARCPCRTEIAQLGRLHKKLWAGSINSASVRHIERRARPTQPFEETSFFREKALRFARHSNEAQASSARSIAIWVVNSQTLRRSESWLVKPSWPSRETISLGQNHILSKRQSTSIRGSIWTRSARILIIGELSAVRRQIRLGHFIAALSMNRSRKTRLGYQKWR